MYHIHTDKYGIGIYYESCGAGSGGYCTIVDDEDDFKLLNEGVFGHTRSVAEQRAREERKRMRIDGETRQYKI